MSSRAEFDRVLEAVIEALPDPVRAILADIPVIVEDEPAAWVLAELGLGRDEGSPSDVCGLHSGIPLTEQGKVFGDSPAPQAIHLFRGPIERLARGRAAALRRQIKITLLHEIGHHHGLTEQELKELGYE